MTETKQGVSRRTVVAGTAWAVPAVVVATAAPAAAASPTSCLTVTFGVNSCTQRDADGNAQGYRLQICFTNVCNVPSNVHVTSVQAAGAPALATDLDVRVPPSTTSPRCAALITYCTDVEVTELSVTFTANPGNPVQVRPVAIPPACSTGVAVCG